MTRFTVNIENKVKVGGGGVVDILLVVLCRNRNTPLVEGVPQKETTFEVSCEGAWVGACEEVLESSRRRRNL